MTQPLANSSQLFSRTVVFGSAATTLSLGLLVFAPLGYRLEFFSLEFALLVLFGLGVVIGLISIAVSLTGLFRTVKRLPSSQRDLWLSIPSVVIGFGLLSIPASFVLGASAPPIHDITTDMVNPPQFLSVVPLHTPNRTVYEGETISSQQRHAYPDIQPTILELPPNVAFDHALATVHERGWLLVDAEPTTGRIEATDTTFWFGFKDDLAIRITPVEDGARIDVRSLSRVGVGDLGANAKRIRRYMTALVSPQK